MQFNLDEFSSKIFAHSNGVKKSINEPYNYETLELKNGLRIFMVENSVAATSAAAMHVAVGYQNDPDEYKGLAHCLEHCLFLGTEDYPREEYFSEFINNNGGDQNAFTTSDHTCFFFSVEKCAFVRGLDIFSGFFTQPLFNQNSIAKEVHAVDSEHKKNINDDQWRTLNALTLALNQEHPLSRFSTGDLTTLLGNTTCCEQATRENGLRLRKELIEFYEDHYSSEKMTLFLYHHNLDEIKEQVKTLFSQVPQRITITDDTSINNLFPEKREEIPVTVYEKVGASDCLHLIWKVPNLNHRSTKYSHSLKLLQKIMSWKGQGSFYQSLLDQELIKGLKHQQYLQIDNSFLAGISFALTNNTDVKLLLRYLDSYLTNLKKQLSTTNGINSLKDKYSELLRVGRLKFLDLRLPSGVDFLQILVNCLNETRVALPDLLAYNMNPLDFEKTLTEIQSLLDCLSLRNCLILSTRDFINTGLPNTEPHYQMKYGKGTIHLSDSTDPIPSFEFFSEPNKFVPKTITLPSNLSDSNLNISCAPELITLSARESENNHRFYLDSDNRFNNLSGTVRLQFTSPTIFKAEASVITNLYLKYQAEKWQSLLEQINYVNSINLHFTGDCISVQITSVEEEVYWATLRLLFGFKNKEFELDVKIWKQILEKERESLETNLKAPPHQQIGDILYSGVLPDHYIPIKTALEQVRKLENVGETETREKIQQYLTIFFGACEITGLYGGNTNSNLAQQLSNWLSDQVVLSSNQLERTINMDKEYYLIRQSSESWECNSCLQYCIYLDTFKRGETIDLEQKVACTMVLSSMMGHLYFDCLRTKKKLGYIVNCRLGALNGDQKLRQLFMCFQVQSPVVKIETLLTETETFIDDFRNQLLHMPLPVFLQMKHSIANKISEEDKNMEMRLDRLFHHLSSTPNNQEPNFLTHLKIAKALENLAHSSLVEYFDKRFGNNKKKIVAGINAL